MPPRSRDASHAGSWYTDDGAQLSRQLDGWLDKVPRHAQGIGLRSAQAPELELPSIGARVIIAPHAGYAYSGAAAAWAYRSLDLTNVQRVFVLGPSHHHYLTRCALSQCTTYETPMGDLTIDTDTVEELHKTGMFDRMSQSVDEAEHSIEMHLPYIHKMLSRKTAASSSPLPPIIPILVGSTTPSTERSYGKLLAPYLADPSTLFVISSDFCHWGSRFRYTYYEPSGSSSGTSLRSNDRPPRERPIHESIGDVDMRCIAAIESGSSEEWCEVLEQTGNTVCGRHPIGIIMCALEVLKADATASGSAGGGEGRFSFVRYERSSEVVNPRDSSVSYCSGFAVL